MLGNIATWKTMVMLQNVCQYCVRIFKEEKHRQLHMFVILRKKVKVTGILIDKPKHKKPKAVLTSENIVAVEESVREDPSTSIHRLSQQLNITETLLRRIL